MYLLIIFCLPVTNAQILNHKRHQSQNSQSNLILGVFYTIAAWKNKQRTKIDKNKEVLIKSCQETIRLKPNPVAFRCRNLSYFCILIHQKVQFMSVVVSQVSKVYGQQKALNNVSLSIQAGEIVGLLGPNGAGKSTLMKILSSYIPASSGTASIFGYDVQLQSVETRKHLGYLPENNPLYSDMYVREYLLFVGRIHQLGNQLMKRVDEMIHLTGLEIEMHKKIRMLSKGYKQRVGIAQALIHDPQVLILDEPTSGLDPNQLIEIRQLIKNIGQNKTVLLSTHIMQEVEALCSRVIIVNKGELVADDKMDKLSRQIAGNGLFVAFEQEVEAAALRKIPGVKGVIRQREGWLLEPQPGKDIRQEVAKWAVDQQLTIVSLSRNSLSMEESFHRLTL